MFVFFLFCFLPAWVSWRVDWFFCNHRVASFFRFLGEKESVLGSSCVHRFFLRPMRFFVFRLHYRSLPKDTPPDGCIPWRYCLILECLFCLFFILCREGGRRRHLFHPQRTHFRKPISRHRKRRIFLRLVKFYPCLVKFDVDATWNRPPRAANAFAVVCLLKSEKE